MEMSSGFALYFMTEYMRNDLKSRRRIGYLLLYANAAIGLCMKTTEL